MGVSSLRWLASKNFSSVYEQVTDPADDVEAHFVAIPSQVKTGKVGGPVGLPRSFSLKKWAFGKN